jgi:hypothetical protein
MGVGEKSLFKTVAVLENAALVAAVSVRETRSRELAGRRQSHVCQLERS